MKTFHKGIAIGYLIMGGACMTESMPPIFIQHMVGLILFTLALIIWRMKWQ